MNSTLQCLSATIPFAKFFTDGSFRKQVNTVNPLGTKGALASTVAQLFGVLWGEQYTFVSPVSFKVWPMVLTLLVLTE
jgi:ubiquitin carboxyl-terminal hydrolase 8